MTTPELRRHGPRCNFRHPPTKDGQAIYEYPNPYFTYIGDWKKGKKDGKGRFMIGPDSYYEGDFVRGEITGRGTRVMPDGSVYEGDFKEGEFHGQGKFTNATTGEEYEGDWRANRREGEGVLKFADKTMYTGNFLAHKRHGHGQYTDAEGNSYDGEWCEDRIEGEGTMAYANGDIYEGGWRAGMKHGQGTIKWAASGLSFSGLWCDDTSEYNPTALELSELPPFTPGTQLSGITVSVVGGTGEYGRKLRVQIEIGRVDPNAVMKKTTRGRKIDLIDKEPRYMVLNCETLDSFVDVIVENGVAMVPSITIPIEAEPNTYTLIASDTSAENPLPQVICDFQWVSAQANANALDKLASRGRGSRRGGTNSRASERRATGGRK